MDYLLITTILHIGFLFCTAQNWVPEGVKEVKWFATHLCKDSKGHNGTCMSLQTCFADTRFPNLSGWSEFISGDYDACAYIKQPAGIPFVGACCTKSMVTVATTNPTTITTPATTKSQTSPTTPAWPMAPAIPDWPPTHPPLPTHPPSLTQPPLPTHPPFLGFPWPWFTQTPVRMKPTSTTPATIILPWLKPKTTTSTTTMEPPTTTSMATTSMATPSPIVPQCGKQGDAFRVVGGQEAGYWPWMTGLIGRRGLFCGGSLVSNYHILTAAHCVYGLSPTDLTVRLGDRDLSTTSDYAHIDVKVSSITIHPSYNTRTNHQDVAILRLASKVTFNKYIQPICLPDSTERSYANQNAIVIGWGATRARGPTSKILMQLTMRVWSVDECQTRFMKTFPGQIVPSNVCAGDGGKDACSGDSGGPLMKVDNGIYTQIGIVSWGVGCGTYNYPGVYTRVTSYLSWIKSNLV